MSREISDEDQIEFLVREIASRRHVYAKRIEQGLMGRETADRELGTLAVILETLQKYPPRHKEIRAICERMIGRINHTTRISDVEILRGMVSDVLDVLDRD